MTLVAVADTHAALWYLSDDPRLSRAALSFIDDAADDGNQIGVSSITLVEATYLMEKGRIEPDALRRLIWALDYANASWLDIPVNREIARALRFIPRDRVPDMPDRIIAATALHLAVPLISRDGHIRLSGVPTIW
jgi:PIN domain nuclease of toxin-antitoxin system